MRLGVGTPKNPKHAPERSATTYSGRRGGERGGGVGWEGFTYFAAVELEVMVGGVSAFFGLSFVMMGFS